jgi:hypothetical protein
MKKLLVKLFSTVILLYIALLCTYKVLFGMLTFEACVFMWTATVGLVFALAPVQVVHRYFKHECKCLAIILLGCSGCAHIESKEQPAFDAQLLKLPVHNEHEDAKSLFRFHVVPEGFEKTLQPEKPNEERRRADDNRMILV